MARFDNRRFGAFTLLDPQLDVSGAVLRDAELALQVRPLLGRGGGWWLVHNEEGVYVRDRAEGERSVWVEEGDGTIWVQPGDDGMWSVHRAEVLKDRQRAPEATEVAYVAEGNDWASRVETGRDPHLQRGGLVSHRSANVIHYGPDGLPEREVRSVGFRALGVARSSYEHTIDYRSFTPCSAEGEVLPVPEGVDRAVTTPRSSAKVPTLTAAVDPRWAELEALQWEARAQRRELGKSHRQLALGGALVGLGAGVVAWRAQQGNPPSEVTVGLYAGSAVVLLGSHLIGITTHGKKARRAEASAEALQGELAAE